VAFTLCTFNVNNLFVRYRFAATFPGDVSGKSAVEDPTLGYLPMYNPGSFEFFNPEQRALAAQALTRDGQSLPDVVCLQEVESLIALRAFNERCLDSAYPYALLIDSRDLRQIDVGVLSKHEILHVRTHLDDRDPHADDPANYPWQFSRDCLEIEIDLPGGKNLTLFVNHLKSKFIDYKAASTPAKQKAARQRADDFRNRQAAAVKKIVHARFPGAKFDSALFAVIGDFNDEPDSAALTPLLQDAGLVSALERIPQAEDRWTYWYRSENTASQIDHILLSPALDAATAGVVPEIERRGISFARTLQDGKPGPKQTHFQHVDDDPNPIPVDFRFPRFAGVTPEEYASDHCPVFLTIG
jgi:endonuclease/exonuclease/phosphatase family metal-dependent hydrolase